MMLEEEGKILEPKERQGRRSRIQDLWIQGTSNQSRRIDHDRVSDRRREQSTTYRIGRSDSHYPDLLSYP